MKLILSFLLLALAIFQFHTHAHDKKIKKEIIPKNIDFVSTTWLEKKGTFRVIAFNSEDNPCFVMENYKDALNGGLTQANEVCRVQLPDRSTLNIQSSASGDMWFENFKWNQHFLKFQLNTESSIYNCKLDLLNFNKMPICQ